MDETTTASAQGNELETPRLISGTPSTLHGSSSSSSGKDESIPTTPPPNSSNSRRPSDAAYHSPDAYTHTHTILPPVTPSSHQFSQNSGVIKQLGNIPQTPFGVGATPASPLKSPSQFKDYEDGERPPIRQLTSKLKTRLNYAFVKYSNGWTNQSLDELEKTVVNHSNNKERESLQRHSGSSLSPLNKNKSPSRITKPSSSKSPIRGHRHSMDFEESSGSAHAAFLTAISKSKSPIKINSPHRNSPSRSPFRSLPPPPLSLKIISTPSDDSSNPSSQKQARSPEAEAIATLMSLSSPQGFKPKLELPKHELPRQRLTFGEKLSTSNETAIATESDTEYEGSDDDERSPTKKRGDFKRMTDEDMKTDSEDDD